MQQIIGLLPEGGSSELFHECNNYPHPPWSTGIVGVPKNSAGYQYARTGNAYAGITFYTLGEGLRENIEVQLINCLNPNRTYYAEFYVSLCNNSSYGIKNVGAYFSNNMLTYAGHHPAMLSLIPHIEYSGSPLAMFKLTRAMMLFTMPMFLIAVFCGGIVFSEGWLAVVCGILKYVGLVVVIVLIRNTAPRIRIDHAVKFFWGPVTVFVLVAVILAFMGW